MAFSDRGGAEGRPRGKRASRRTSDRGNDELQLVGERSTIGNEYLTTGVGAASKFNADATTAFPGGIKPDPYRVTGQSHRTRRGRGGKIKGLGRGDTTYLKGQNNNLPSIQQDQDVIGKQSVLYMSLMH